MKSMTSLFALSSLGFCVFAGVACAPAILMSTPVSKSGDGWAITLGEVKEGPNEYVAEGGVGVEPGDDQKLIWTTLTVRNDGAMEESFAYDTCLLTSPGQSRPPSVVSKREGEVNSALDMAEAISKGQERTRQLVFTYPKDQRPTSMRCGSVVLPIKSAR
jgi:hypothetical protein